MHTQQPNGASKILIFLYLGTVATGICGTVLAPDIFNEQMRSAIHLGILLAATILSFRYALHRNARNQRTIIDRCRFGESTQQLKITTSEDHVHECCLTGIRRL